jgi:hypothetical protein
MTSSSTLRSSGGRLYPSAGPRPQALVRAAAAVDDGPERAEVVPRALDGFVVDWALQARPAARP